MSVQSSSLPLTRRLVTWYLAFGLSGLFLCLVITMLLIYQERITDFVALAAIIPLAVLAVGAIVLTQAVRFHADIEQQLCRISSDPSGGRVQCETLSGSGPAVVGWNSLLERLATQESLSALEKRLSGSISIRRDHRPSVILQALAEGIALTEPDGRILYANRCWRSWPGAVRPTSWWAGIC